MIEIISAADHDWILEARSPKGQHGVGLVLAKSFAAGRAIEPHVDWFPWATRRNKIESMAAFFRQVGKMFKIFIFSPEDETKVWGWYAKRRMLTRGGQIVDHFAVGQHARLFYTRGP